MRELSPAEQIAVACALKAPAVTKSKQALPDESSESVDVIVRVHGTVTKGTSTAGGTTTEPAIVEVSSLAIMLDVLKRNGIGPPITRCPSVSSERDLMREYGPRYGVMPTARMSTAGNRF